MKAKSFVAYALTACAIPAAPALAQNAEPSGPQGTGWYGAPYAAVPAGGRWVYQGHSFDTNPPVPAP
jgi:hypothetical protein